MKLFQLFETLDDPVRSILFRDCSQFIKEKGGIDTDNLYRGFRSTKHFQIKRFDTNPNRSPLDSTIFVHTLLDDVINSLTGYKMRSSNVAFATGEELGAGSFGTPYIFFPVDNYTYVYFHHIYDMVEVVPIIMHSVIKFLSPLSTAIDGISDLIEDLRIATHQTNLSNSATLSAISLSELISKHISTPDISRVHEAIMNGASSVLKNKLEFNTSLRHGIENGAEMMFNCSSYYLVDTKEFLNTEDVK